MGGAKGGYEEITVSTHRVKTDVERHHRVALSAHRSKGFKFQVRPHRHQMVGSSHQPDVVCAKLLNDERVDFAQFRVEAKRGGARGVGQRSQPLLQRGLADRGGNIDCDPHLLARDLDVAPALRVVHGLDRRAEGPPESAREACGQSRQHWGLLGT